MTLNKLFSLVICGFLAGAIVAAAAFPAAGVTALAAKAVTDSFQNLPADLRDPLIPQTSVLLDKNGEYITSFYDENRQYMKLSEIPDIMQQAMIAAEDQRFHDHGGVDPAGMVRAFFANKRAGDIQQGASTLTQQYVKMILQYAAKTKDERDAATAPTVARKIREARYAVAVEKKLTKKEILERYLNLSFFGNRAHGVAAAAKAYFSKHPKELTLGEAALLAGLVQAPSKYNPARGNGEEARERRAYVLERMVDQGFVTQKESDEANAEDITLNPSPEPRKCENAPRREYYGFYCSFFIEWVRENPEFGKNSVEREMFLERGGFRIQTALDPAIQDAAQAAVDKQISRNNRMMVGIVLLEPGTGRVLAMANNRTFSIAENPGGRKYPNTTIPLLSGTESSPGYQSGSTNKMFTMVAALERGIPLDVKIHSPYQYRSRFLTGSGSAACSVGPDVWVYCPKNYSEAVTGVHTMHTGFGESVNTFFVQLEEKVTVAGAVDAAKRMGIPFRYNNTKDANYGITTFPEKNGAFTLGTAQVTPLDMATAYATLAARGLYCKPLPLQSITASDGSPLPYANPECQQTIAPDVADAATDAARCPVGEKAHAPCGSALTAPQIGRAIDHPVAGKTGTTDNNNAAWFVGYTRNLAGAVVKVNPDRTSETVGATHEPVAVFKDTFAAVTPSRPYEDFVPPTEGRLHGDQVRIPVVAGANPQDAKGMLESSGFKARTEPDPVESDQLPGRVAYTNPAGGTDAPKGSTITIYISKGREPEPSPTPEGEPSEQAAPG